MSRTTLVQDIADQVTCGICLEHFNIPKTVTPCLHNFCECCLQGMIESTSHPTGRASTDPTVYATFSFPCPSCRGAVEFPVRIPHPWVMKQIAQEAVKKEFKTNFQIKNQLDILNTKIKQGCQEHQGEIKMWFCKACKVIICQFCVLQDHNSSEHEITLLNLKQKKQGLKHSKEQAQEHVVELESSCAAMEEQLSDIHKTKGRFEDQKKLIMDEFVAIHNKLGTMESQIYTKQQNVVEQLTSSEMQILQVYQEASEDVEHYKTKVDELDRKLADADFGIGSLSDETETEPFLKPNSIPVVEIPKLPEISLDLLQNGMLEIKETLENISRDLELSDIEAEPGSASKNDQPVHTERISGQPSLTASPSSRPTPHEFQQLHPVLRGLTNLPLGNERALTPVGMQAPQTHQQHTQQLHPQQLHQITDLVTGYGRVNQQSQQFIFQRPLTARLLAQASQKEQKQMLGERFYPIICQMHGDLAGKITGMLLEIDNDELLHMLQSRESLVRKVKEAVEALKALQSKDAGNSRQQYIQGTSQEPRTAYILAQASKNEQKQMLGEQFYPIIYQMHGELAGMITGMLLAIDNAELLHMLESRDALVSKVEEAVEVLQACQSKKTNPVKTSAPKLRDESQSDDNTLATLTGLLGSMFAKKKCSNNQIRDWIESNIDVQLRRQNIFIRALVAIVCRSSMKDESNRCDPDLLKGRARLLPKYIDGDFTKELQALFAVQELNHKLNNPPGFLRLIFDVFYDEHVISEDAFCAWRESDDSNEPKVGKNDALASVEDFFVPAQ